ncbi:hypothetical protein [Scardovia wiggsiae]
MTNNETETDEKLEEDSRPQAGEPDSRLAFRSGDSGRGEGPGEAESGSGGRASHREEPRKTRKSTRKFIARYILAPFFAVAAVIALVAGILFSTVWGPRHTLSARAENLNTNIVYTADGVANISGSRLTVKVTGRTGTEVCVAVANARDISEWAASEKHTVLTGLASWSSLSSRVEGGTAAQSSMDTFRSSDLWQSVTCNQGSVTVNVPDSDGKAVIAGSSRPISSVTMDWVRLTPANFSRPWYIAAGVCAVLAILSATILAAFKRRPKAKRNLAADDAEHQDAEQTQVLMDITEQFRYQRPDVVPTHRDPGRQHGRGLFRRRNRGVISAEEALTADSQLDAASGTPAIVDPRRANMVERVARKNASEGSDATAGGSSDSAVTATDILNRARSHRGSRSDADSPSNQRLSALAARTAEGTSDTEGSGSEAAEEASTTASFSEMAAWLERVRREGSEPPEDNTVDILADEKEDAARRRLFENSDNTQITDIESALDGSRDIQGPAADDAEAPGPTGDDSGGTDRNTDENTESSGGAND